MKFIYYLFGHLNQDFSTPKSNKFHYLIEEILCGDTICTLTKECHGLKIFLNNNSKYLNINTISSSINWSLISLVDSRFDGFIASKDDISQNKELHKLSGKWKEIKCFSESFALGISSTNDLFYIEYDEVPRLTVEVFLSKLKVDTVSCGSDHILILTSSRVLSKGLGSRGQLGHGDLENLTEFREIVTLGCVVSQIACGLWHSVALTEAGDVYCWGWNESGQLGVPCFTDREILEAQFDNFEELEEPSTVHMCPVIVTFPIDDWSITKIDCGSRHTVCLNDDGRVFTFGWGAMGQLGREDGQSYDYPILIDDFLATSIKCTHWGTMLTVEAHEDALLADDL